MKKTYIAPSIESISMDAETFLAGSIHELPTESSALDYIKFESNHKGIWGSNIWDE